MRRKNIYIAGPMRGIKDFNFPAFFKAQKYFESRGWMVFNPAQKDIETYGKSISVSATGDVKEAEAKGFSLRHALMLDTSWICNNADAICMLPGWKNSKGAIAEHALAVALDLEIIEYNEIIESTIDESGQEHSFRHPYIDRM